MRNLIAALAASACILGSTASAREYPTDPNRYLVQPPLWTVCETSFYAPQASGDKHAGQIALQLWSEPFKPSGNMRFERANHWPPYIMLPGEIADPYLQFLSEHLGRTEEHFQRGECHTYSSKEEADAGTAKLMSRSSRTNSVVPAPTKAMLDRSVRSLAGTSGVKQQPEREARSEATEKPAAADAAPTGPTPAEIAAEKRRAVAERNRLAQEKYEAELAVQKRQVEEFAQAEAEVARKKAEQAAAAEQALAAHNAQLAAHAEAERKHQADLAAHEAATKKLLADFDKRHNLGKASTDTDANRCVTTSETRLNDTFQGNTAASVMNGCGQPVDVKICLMTDKGWNCGATNGLGPQQRWSHSSFNATGQVFSDARISGSSRPLASPN